MNVITEILQQIHDEADHILGTESQRPHVIARENAKAIKALAKLGLQQMRPDSSVG